MVSSLLSYFHGNLNKLVLIRPNEIFKSAGFIAEIILLPVTPVYYSIRIHSKHPLYASTQIKMNI